MRWRLLKRFQQRIEAVGREHVHLIHQVNLVSSTRWRVLHVIQQLASILDLGAGSCIDFDQVNETPFIDFHTGGTHAAGFRTDTRFTVERFGEDTRHGGLTHTARASEQISMVQAVIVQRIDQRAKHMLLPHHLGKLSRPPFTRQNLITH